jgi:hypothetical protein
MCLNKTVVITPETASRATMPTQRRNVLCFLCRRNWIFKTFCLRTSYCKQAHNYKIRSTFVPTIPRDTTIALLYIRVYCQQRTWPTSVMSADNRQRSQSSSPQQQNYVYQSCTDQPTLPAHDTWHSTRPLSDPAVFCSVAVQVSYDYHNKQWQFYLSAISGNAVFWYVLNVVETLTLYCSTQY